MNSNSNVEKRYYDKENNVYVSLAEIQSNAAAEETEVEDLGKQILSNVPKSDLMDNATINPAPGRPTPVNNAPKIVSTSKLPDWKYAENEMLRDLQNYLASTYDEHYNKNDDDIQCFDAWIALGDSGPTFRNTALKYLWRYGNKNGNNKDDIMKALHYMMLMLYVEHYKK